MFRNWPLFVIGIVLVISSVPAQAEVSGADLLNRLIEQPGDLISRTAPMTKENNSLRLTSNKNVLVRLDQDAASVVVNNPNHISVMLDSPRLLIIMPRLPGTTSFTALNSLGEVVLQKDVIVTNVQPQYVRIRRMCSGNDASCLPAAYYYCPDGCYEVTPVNPAGGGNIPPPPASAAAAAKEAVNSAASTAPSAPPAAGAEPGGP